MSDAKLMKFSFISLFLSHSASIKDRSGVKDVLAPIPVKCDQDVRQHFPKSGCNIFGYKNTTILVERLGNVIASKLLINLMFLHDIRLCVYLNAISSVVGHSKFLFA